MSESFEWRQLNIHTNGECLNAVSLKYCFFIEASTSRASVNWWILKVSVGPLGNRAALNDNWLAVLLKITMCDTWNIPDKLTKSLIRFLRRSRNDAAVNGSIIRRKSLVKYVIFGNGKPRCITNEWGAFSTSGVSVSSTAWFFFNAFPLRFPIFREEILEIQFTLMHSNCRNWNWKICCNGLNWFCCELAHLCESNLQNMTFRSQLLSSRFLFCQTSDWLMWLTWSWLHELFSIYSLQFSCVFLILFFVSFSFCLSFFIRIGKQFPFLWNESDGWHL